MTKFQKLASVLSLQFDDTYDERRERCFSLDMAARIKEFVDQLRDGTELYICCDSGESRSAAISAAVLRYLGKDEMVIWNNPHYHPNTLVYKRQCEAFGITTSDAEVRHKKSINEKALSDAIHNSRIQK